MGLHIKPVMLVALLLLQDPGLRSERPRVASSVSSLRFGGAHEGATSKCREASRHRYEEPILYRGAIVCARRNCVPTALDSSRATAADGMLNTAPLCTLVDTRPMRSHQPFATPAIPQSYDIPSASNPKEHTGDRVLLRGRAWMIKAAAGKHGREYIHKCSSSGKDDRPIRHAAWAAL